MAWTNRGDLSTAAEEAALHTVPAGGTSGQVLAKTSGTDYATGWSTPSGGSATPTQVDTYVWDGTALTHTNFTWTKPTGAKRVHIALQATGGGGGSGRRGVMSLNRGGGGGGSGGNYDELMFNAADLPSTVYGRVQYNPKGGAAVTVNDTDGNQGDVTADTVWVSSSSSGSITAGVFYFGAIGGKRGLGGTASGGTGGTSAVTGLRTGTNGVAGSSTSAIPNAGTSILPLVAPGGAGGGSATSTNTGYDGGRSRFNSTLDPNSVGGVGTSVSGATAGTGTNGTAGYGHTVLNGSGGAGGGGSGLGAGGAGGNGNGYGAGGGGGGASVNGYPSGVGGDGGPGYVIITTYF